LLPKTVCRGHRCFFVDPDDAVSLHELDCACPMVCDPWRATRSVSLGPKFLNFSYSISRESKGLARLLVFPTFVVLSVTSQIFNLECYTLDHHCISFFFAFWFDPTNSTQLKDPRRELGISLFSYSSFSRMLKRGSFDFNYFLFEYFFYKNKRERIK
jgi:hypothetical protein